MNKTFALSLAVSLLAGGVLAFTAQPAEANYRNHVNKRQYHQQQRIYSGVNSGALTQKEAWYLQQKQQRLAAQEFRYRQSGNGLNPYEAAKLNQRQNALSKTVYNQKHDGQYRP